MSHLLSLVMVISSLSIDPECLNLPQKDLVIYAASLSAELQKKHLSGGKTMALFRQEVIELQISILFH